MMAMLSHAPGNPMTQITGSESETSRGKNRGAGGSGTSIGGAHAPASGGSGSWTGCVSARRRGEAAPGKVNRDFNFNRGERSQRCQEKKTKNCHHGRVLYRNLNLTLKIPAFRPHRGRAVEQGFTGGRSL